MSTSSTRSTRLPFSRALASTGTRKAPWRFSCRCALVSPTCRRVRLTRASRKGSQGTPLSVETAPASAMAWLKRRHHSRQRCRGTGTITSASCSSSAPARVIMPPKARASSSRSLYLSRWTSRLAVPSYSATARARWNTGGSAMAAGESKRLAEIDGKGRSEPLAEGPLDEADLRPALGAQGMGLAGRGLAGDAGRGIEQAERRLPGLPPSATEAGAPSSLQGIEGLAHGSSLAEGGALCHSRPGA